MGRARRSVPTGGLRVIAGVVLRPWPERRYRERGRRQYKRSNCIPIAAFRLRQPASIAGFWRILDATGGPASNRCWPGDSVLPGGPPVPRLIHFWNSRLKPRQELAFNLRAMDWIRTESDGESEPLRRRSHWTRNPTLWAPRPSSRMASTPHAYPNMTCQAALLEVQPKPPPTPLCQWPGCSNPAV